MGLSYDLSFISFFLLLYGRTILVLQIFLSIYPSSYSILILYGFFLKKIFDSESWRKKFGWTGERKKYSDLTFSQNFEEKKLFQHFANLIKIRSTHLLPIFYTSDPKKKIENREQVCRSNHTPVPRRGYTVLPLSVCPSVLPRYFSQQLDSRNLIFGHKFHIGTPYRGKRFWTCLIPTSCLPT